jgi:hypothetical protein
MLAEPLTTVASHLPPSGYVKGLKLIVRVSGAAIETLLKHRLLTAISLAKSLFEALNIRVTSNFGEMLPTGVTIPHKIVEVV